MSIKIHRTYPYLAAIVLVASGCSSAEPTNEHLADDALKASQSTDDYPEVVRLVHRTPAQRDKGLLGSTCGNAVVIAERALLTTADALECEDVPPSLRPTHVVVPASLTQTRLIPIADIATDDATGKGHFSVLYTDQPILVSPLPTVATLANARKADLVSAPLQGEVRLSGSSTRRTLSNLEIVQGHYRTKEKVTEGLADRGSVLMSMVNGAHVVSALHSELTPSCRQDEFEYHARIEVANAWVRAQVEESTRRCPRHELFSDGPPTRSGPLDQPSPSAHKLGSEGCVGAALTIKAPVHLYTIQVRIRDGSLPPDDGQHEPYFSPAANGKAFVRLAANPYGNFVNIKVYPAQISGAIVPRDNPYGPQLLPTFAIDLKLVNRLTEVSRLLRPTVGANYVPMTVEVAANAQKTKDTNSYEINAAPVNELPYTLIFSQMADPE